MGSHQVKNFLLYLRASLEEVSIRGAKDLKLIGKGRILYRPIRNSESQFFSGELIKRIQFQ